MRSLRRRRLEGQSVRLRRQLAWSAAVARATGKRHRSEGKPCEDFVGRAVRDGLAIIALADGAGSVALAAEGACVAVQSVIRYIAKNFYHLRQTTASGRSQGVLGHVRSALAKVAQKRRVRIDELASTLLFAASDGKTLLIGQIGDGRVGVRNTHSGHWSTAVEPSRGEFANETWFVTTPDSDRRFNLVSLPSKDFDACALMSDGAEAALFDKSRQSFAKAMDSIAGWVSDHPVAKVEKALTQELATVLTTKTLDDVSIALLVGPPRIALG